MKFKSIIFTGILLSASLLAGCAQNNQATQSDSLTALEDALGDEAPRIYQQESVHQVTGRQGVAVYEDYYFVSGTKNLVKYDRDWNTIIDNFDPFSTGYDKEVNHIGDIDVYNDEIYCGVELFLDGVASNIQIGIYDADTLEFKRSFNFDPKSGQTEVAGICVDPENELVWMCSWGDETGRYLYKYDLSGNYIGKIHVHPIPQWFQGVVYYDGDLYITSDDGDADFDEPDHVYKVVMDETGTSATVIEELALTDVIKHGEIEGLSFDKENNQLLVHVNRGAKIVRGMPVGLYDGYDKEINEVYVYDIIP